MKFYCVLQHSVCRSQWNSCVKVPRCCGCAWIFFYLLHRLLADAAACGIYTAESRTSYCSGCTKSAMVIWQQLFFFSILALPL